MIWIFFLLMKKEKTRIERRNGEQNRDETTKNGNKKVKKRKGISH